MASNQTSNYGLNQWEATDQVLRTDFNQDNAKLDAALKALADKETELEGTLAGQAADIAKLGNCSIERFTYVGTGNGNAIIPFHNAPLFFVVMGGSHVLIGSCLSTKATRISYYSVSSSTSVSDLTITWSDTSLTAQHVNVEDQTYQVFALSVGET